jgi:predicted heme/steroid binding protein
MVRGVNVPELVEKLIDAAGSHLTGSLEDAPHPADLLRRFPMVGTLRGDWPPCEP